jgi:hypothetical protein
MEKNMAKFKLRKKTKAELSQKAQKLYTKGGKIASGKGEKAYKKTMKKEKKFFGKDIKQYESVHGQGTYPEKFAKENIEFSKKEAEKSKAGAVKKAYDKNLMIKFLTARGYKIEKRKAKR